MKQNIRYRISLVLSVALCLFACNEEDLVEVTNQELSSLELYTSSINTRTSLLEDGTTVVWSEDDELAVYDYETTKHCFMADNVSGSSARFLGKITAPMNWVLRRSLLTTKLWYRYLKSRLRQRALLHPI